MGCAICFVARGSPKAAKSLQFSRTSGFQYCSTFRSILSCFASFLLAHEVFFSDFFPVLFRQQCKNFPLFFFEHIFVHLLKKKKKKKKKKKRRGGKKKKKKKKKKKS